jgi:hypothetical protein
MHGRRGRKEQEKKRAKYPVTNREKYKTKSPNAVKYNPEDPATWPHSVKGREKKMLHFLDILTGESREGSPKGKYLDDVFEGRRRGIQIDVDREMMETISDIEGMYKIGGFGNIPLVVAEKWASKYSNCRPPFDPELLTSSELSDRGWTPTAVIRMSLEVFRYYLMGSLSGL